jgi:Reverse transcriptase (RNA-dependent DNA polymerase)/GIY-YIG catalytic domain
MRRLYTGNANQKRNKRRAYVKYKHYLCSNNITNLSTHKLSYAEISVLNKGLSFVPNTQTINTHTLDNDVNRFERTLQIHYFFAKKDNTYDPSDRRPFETNSTWWPKKLNGDISAYCQKLKKELFALHRRKNKRCNLSIKERKALNELRNNTSIVIKKADKNSGIVILDRDDYYKKVVEMLYDEHVYTKLDHDDTQEVKNKADLIFTDLSIRELISHKQFTNLTKYSAKCPTFYGMPKIHKPGVPLRPIVSQINGPAYAVNKYVHELLETAESHIPYLFKDTTAFLNTIENCILTSEDTFLVTMDVVSLYTNIPHKEAIEFICEQYYDTISLWNSPMLPVDVTTLQRLLSFILDNCTFNFSGTYYRQKYGCPMGAPASVRIANIFMYKLLKKFSIQCRNELPSFFGRLIDDIFFLWTGTEQTLLELHTEMNAFHSTIKYEMNYSKISVNFLDTTVYVEDGKIKTKLYRKPTDKKLYLHFTSNHPVHVKKAIPYSQAIRYRRIINDQSILTTELDDLHTRFTTRGYPDNLVKDQLNRVLTVSRQSTLTYNTKKHTLPTNDKPFLPLIITFDQKLLENCNIYSTVTNTWRKFVNSSNKIKNVFDGTLPQIVFKRGTTISNILIRSKFTYRSSTSSTVPYQTDVFPSDTDNILALVELLNEQQQNNKPVSKCLIPRCLCCYVITEDHCSFTSTSTKISYDIKGLYDCNTTNIIYLITCTKCKLQYVGQTARKLKDRLNNHRSDIKLCKNTAIAIHFNNIGHRYSHLRITPIELVTDTKYREIREKYWIKTLNTKYPLGINHYPITDNNPSYLP